LSDNFEAKADAYFTIIPEWVLYSNISPQGVRLYGVLRRFADSGGECFPSRKTLANRLQVDSTKPVDRALKELVNIGAVLIEQRRDAKGDLTTNLYTVYSVRRGDDLIPRWGHISPNGGDENVPTGGDENVPYNESHIKREPIELEDSKQLKQAFILANLLAELIEKNGSKLPKVTDKWVTTMERMLRIDDRSFEEIEGAIKWSQKDEFWQGNILSPDKLRKHFDRMRIQAQRKNRGVNALMDWLKDD